MSMCLHTNQDFGKCGFQHQPFLGTLLSSCVGHNSSKNIVQTLVTLRNSALRRHAIQSNMALWRISLVFAAIFFGPASCARLKKSTTQRKLAESALVKSSAPDQNEKQLVSDKLMDQKDKIDEFISEHEANLKKNELSLAHLEANHAQTVNLPLDCKIPIFLIRMVSNRTPPDLPSHPPQPKPFILQNSF